MALALVGFVTGLLSAVLGIGGGSVVIVGLTLFFGYTIREVICAALAVAVPTALVGVVTHYLINPAHLKWVTASGLIIGSLAGARCGVAASCRMSNTLLRLLFAAFLVFVGMKLAGIITLPAAPVTSSAAYPFLILTGLAAGFGSSLFGLGGGVIAVPALCLFFGLTIHEAVPTSLAMIVPTGLAGVFFYRAEGIIDLSLVRHLVPTALVGAVIGAVLANVLPGPILQKIFGAFVILCAVKVVVKTEG